MTPCDPQQRVRLFISVLCHPGPQLEDSEVKKSSDPMFHTVLPLCGVGGCLDDPDLVMWPLGIVCPYGMTSAFSALWLASAG